MLFPTVRRTRAARRAANTTASPTGCTACRRSPTCRTPSPAIEGGLGAFAVPSGLTATTLPLLALAGAGDHVLVTDAVYGPTRRFCDHHLTADRRRGELLRSAGGRGDREGDSDRIRESSSSNRQARSRSTSRTFRRSPTSRTRAARSSSLDNSWATPFFFRSFDHGVDVVGPCGDQIHWRPFRRAARTHHRATKRRSARLHRLWTDMGVTASPRRLLPRACAGCARCATRLARHQASALAVAQWLRARPEVKEVIYPALPGSRGHALWQRDFTGAIGALRRRAATRWRRQRIDAMLDGMRLFGMGWSWGGFESLIIPTYPERTRTATRWDAGGPCLRVAHRPRGRRGPDRRSR